MRDLRTVRRSADLYWFHVKNFAFTPPTREGIEPSYWATMNAISAPNQAKAAPAASEAK
jgi:hypothetical protein